MTCKTIKLKDDPNTLIFNNNSSSPIHQCTITWGSMLKIILSIIALSCVINGASNECTVYTDIRPIDLGSVVSGSPEASISSLPIIISLKGTSDSDKYESAFNKEYRTLLSLNYDCGLTVFHLPAARHSQFCSSHSKRIATGQLTHFTNLSTSQKRSKHKKGPEAVQQALNTNKKL